MKFDIIKKEEQEFIAHIISEDVVFNDAQEALELIMNINYVHPDIRSFIIEEHNVPETFFDLKTGLAGEILQKFSTYRCRLAIVGNFNRYSSSSLRDFIRESNRMGRIIFVASPDEAISNFLFKFGF